MEKNVRREYETILTAIVLENGLPRWAPNDRPGMFGGPVDYKDGEHIRKCVIVSTGRVDEDVEWSEWAGTFAESDKIRHGVSVFDVTCACGKIVKREVIWETTVADVATAVFTKMYEMLNGRLNEIAGE